MSTISDELFAIADHLESVKCESDMPSVSDSLSNLKNTVDKIQKSWCGSWLGHHSCTYYRDLQPPPPGAHFSKIDGFRNSYFSDTVGDWREYSYDDIKRIIYEISGNPDLELAKELAKKASDIFCDRREEVVSLLTTWWGDRRTYKVERMRDMARCPR